MITTEQRQSLTEWLGECWHNEQGDGWGNYTWIAICEGKCYFCSMTEMGRNRNIVYFNCAPEKK